MKQIIENNLIQKLVSDFPRSPWQKNTCQQADAEIISLPDGDWLLALTMDSIVEEIESGLYRDPYLMGWMSILVNASDLAAVGADPMGIVINETLIPDIGESFLKKIQQGIADAATICRLPVLGGDTNFSERMELSGCAIGLIQKQKYLTRLGCQVGDLVFTSGYLGLGNTFAVVQMQSGRFQNKPRIEYLPRPRLKEGALIRDFANCCMDTSDGVLTTLDQLMRLNGLGFTLNADFSSYLHPQAELLCRQTGIPELALLTGPHGEFELLFTIPTQNVRSFQQAAAAMNWHPLPLGRVIRQPEILLTAKHKTVALDSAALRNLFSEKGQNVQSYIQAMLQITSSIQQELNHGIKTKR